MNIFNIIKISILISISTCIFATNHADKSDITRAQQEYDLARARFGAQIEASDRHLGLLLQMNFDAKIYGQNIQEIADEALNPLAELITKNKRYHLAAAGTGVMATIPGVDVTPISPSAALADINAAYSYAAGYISPYVENINAAKNVRESIRKLFRGISVPAYPAAASW